LRVAAPPRFRPVGVVDPVLVAALDEWLAGYH
jgi:hypothetical protein